MEKMSYEVSMSDWKNLNSLPLTDGGEVDNYEEDEQLDENDDEERFEQLNSLPMYSDDENPEIEEEEPDAFEVVFDCIKNVVVEDVLDHLFGPVSYENESDYDHQDFDEQEEYFDANGNEEGFATDEDNEYINEENSK